jgi:L-amino acid N-acyltransferase YncA
MILAFRPGKSLRTPLSRTPVITRVLIVAEMDTRNAASISLAEALGFERIGTTLGADRFKGSVSDGHRYELRVDEEPGAT